MAYNRAHFVLVAAKRSATDSGAVGKLERIIRYVGEREYAELQDYSVEHR